MNQGFELVAEQRQDAGKGASRRLRRDGKVPAIIYGGGKPPVQLCLDRNQVIRNLEEEAFLSSVITIRVAGEAEQAILKDVQMHPAKRMVLHMDLQRVIATEKIRMAVPLHFTNEAVSPGVKLQGGTVAHLLTEVEISCLPRDLPEFIEVDLGNMSIDDMLHLSDLKLPAGVEIPELAQGPEHDHAVVTMNKIKGTEPGEAGGEGGGGEGTAA